MIKYKKKKTEDEFEEILRCKDQLKLIKKKQLKNEMLIDKVKIIIDNISSIINILNNIINIGFNEEIYNYIIIELESIKDEDNNLKIKEGCTIKCRDGKDYKNFEKKEGGIEELKKFLNFEEIKKKKKN